MKLGIITFYCSHNYGAMLQAYGLQEYLRGLGHEVYVIDFKPEYKIKQYKKSSCRYWLSRNPKMCVTRLVNYIRTKKKRNMRWEAFELFMVKRFMLYPYNRQDDFHDFDAIIIGSDQVWSPAHTGGKFDEIMFGKGFKCKIISYAASCTSYYFCKGQQEFFSNYLDSFAAVSVREHQFMENLQPFTNRPISVVLDPTLLAGFDIYNRIATPINKSNKYVLIYEIGQHQEVYRMAQHLARQLKAEIVEVTNGILNFHRQTMDESASPEKFLGYIKNAACVVTTSFHGTAFSIIFQKPFYMVLQGSDADIRMKSLLERLELQSRMVHMGELPTFKMINYKVVNQKLSVLVNFSKEFINNSLRM